MGGVWGRLCILGVGVVVGGLIMLGRRGVPPVVMENLPELGTILGRRRM